VKNNTKNKITKTLSIFVPMVGLRNDLYFFFDLCSKLFIMSMYSFYGLKMYLFIKKDKRNDDVCQL
jgi:hypothetical protein